MSTSTLTILAGMFLAFETVAEGWAIARTYHRFDNQPLFRYRVASAWLAVRLVPLALFALAPGTNSGAFLLVSWGLASPALYGWFLVVLALRKRIYGRKSHKRPSSAQ